MPQKNLTDRFLASNLRPSTRTNYFDTKVAGLVLRVAPTGSKAWSFVYRLLGGSSQWIALGSYPSVKLADARETARGYRRAVDAKRDPAAERRAELEAAKIPPPPPEPVAPVFTFEKMSRVYLAFAKGKKKTWYDDELKIKKYLLPAWGELPVRDITRAHVHELLDRVVADGMKGGVNRLQMLISRIFVIALDRGHVDAHPAARMIKRIDEKANARTRVLTDDEIRKLRAELDKVPGEAADAVWLRLVLGQRAEETAGMPWSELDVKARTWFLDGKRTKNKRPHLLFLPTTAIAILERRRDAVDENEPNVFPALANDDESTSRPYGIRTLTTITDTMKFEWRDLRRTFATRLAELGVSEDTIGRLLNHAKYGVTGKHYNHYKYLPEKQQALEAWDRELKRVLANEPKKPKIVSIKSRRR